MKFLKETRAPPAEAPLMAFPNANLFELGHRHAAVKGEVDKVWQGICADLGNDRNRILRFLSVTQTGNVGSYRDGWIEKRILDTGKNQKQAEGAYNRHVSGLIDKFAPSPAERAKRKAAELETS